MSIFSFKDKIGPGVGKNEEKAPAYIRFFKIYFTNFPTMVGLNLLYIFACLPIVTIGPATAAINYVMRNYVRGVHVDPFHDFTVKCKENFKQGFAATIIYGTVAALTVFASVWYSNRFRDSGETMYMIFFAIVLLVGFLIIGSLMYLFPMMVSFDLPLKQLIRNSLILCTAKIFRTLGMMLFSFVFLVIMGYLWQIGLIFILLMNFSLVFLLNNFAVYPVLVKHIAKQEENADKPEDEEQIFRDTV